MSNMSYCRFENTALALADCLDAMQHINRHEETSAWMETEWENGGEEQPLNEYESRGLNRIIQMAKEIVEFFPEEL